MPLSLCGFLRIIPRLCLKYRTCVLLGFLSIHLSSFCFGINNEGLFVGILLSLMPLLKILFSDKHTCRKNWWKNTIIRTYPPRDLLFFTKSLKNGDTMVYRYSLKCTYWMFFANFLFKHLKTYLISNQHIDLRQT